MVDSQAAAGISPHHPGKPSAAGKYRGQRQTWFLMRFTGTDEDVNIATSHQEFRDWLWIEPDQLPELIVPFKKKLYRDILSEFAHLI